MIRPLCLGVKANAILDIHGIIKMAGELDDRWSALRKQVGREESPDTTLRKQSRATRLVTPGEPLTASSR